MKTEVHMWRIVAIFLILSPKLLHAQSLYRCDQGKVSFKSEAELELIQATSGQLKGVLNIDTRNFAFSVEITSFIGFNSPLQREHFNENYMESNDFPKAVFSGRIIGDVDFSTDGSYDIRAKGLMEIHGISSEEIIKCTILVERDKMFVISDFHILLDDYGITIPKVVSRKISEEIAISIYAELTQ